MKSRKFLSVVIGLLAGIVLLAGCNQPISERQDDLPESPQSAPANPATEPANPANAPNGKLAVGDTYHFGQYDWRVLDVQDDRALLLSEDIIEQKAYNEEWEDVTWENSTLRIYLNGDFFYQQFDAEEQKSILEVSNANEDNPRFETSGGNQTKDRVFLLSIGEVIKYFGDSGEFGELKDGKKSYISDQYDSKRVAKFNGSGSWWWLRSPGGNQDSAAGVIGDGYVGLSGGSVGTEGGVRPALWLNLES